MLQQGQINTNTALTNWSVDHQKTIVSEKMWYWAGVKAMNLFAGANLQMDVVRCAPLPPGPKILAANHPTTIDPFLMLTLLPEQISILVTGGVFNVPLIGSCIRRGGHVPVVRGEGREAYERAKRLLESGRSIGIFPEGALSVLNRAQARSRTGAAHLSMSTGAPVIPLGISLDQKRIRYINLPENGRSIEARYYARGPYAITIGKPLYFHGDVDDRELVNSTTERIMQCITQLSLESADRIKTSTHKTYQPYIRPRLIEGGQRPVFQAIRSGYRDV